MAIDPNLRKSSSNGTADLDGTAPRERVTGTPNAPRPTRNRLLLPALGIGALLLLAVIVSRRRGGGAQSGRRPAGSNVKVANFVRVGTGTLTQTLTVTGQLRANQNIGLSSKIIGRVARVVADEGERVRRGQLLVTLEDDELRAQVQQQQAGLSSARVRLQQARAGLPARIAEINTTITQAQAGVLTAQARLRQAVLNAPVRGQTARSGLNQARQTVSQARERLSQARETARQTDLTTQAQIRAAQAGVRAAQAALADVVRGSRRQQIAQAEQNVRVLEAQLENAETELRRQQTLVTGGAAPQSALDTAQTQRNVASANLEAARQNLSLVQEGSTNEQIQQAQQQVRQAQAQLAQAQAGRAAVVNAQSEVTSALSQLTSAQSAQAQAQANLAEIPQAQEDIRAAREAVAQARAQLQAARANRAQIGVARADVPAAQAGVEQAQALLDAAEVNLRNARLYSPVDGVVTAKNTDVGSSITPGVSLLNIVSLRGVYFEGQVAERDLPRVRTGQPVQVSAPSVSNRPLQGAVNEVIPVADQRLRLFRVRVGLPDAPPSITPGSFARGTITTEVAQNALLLPAAAVQTDEDDNASVLIAETENGKLKAKTRKVKVGASQGEQVEIASGLQRGDTVLLNAGDIGEGDDIKLATRAGFPGADGAGANGGASEAGDAAPGGGADATGTGGEGGGLPSGTSSGGPASGPGSGSGGSSGGA